MIDYHANYLSTLYSFNQGSLYCRSGKASPSFLVKPMAQAIVYLNAEIDDLLGEYAAADKVLIVSEDVMVGMILRNLLDIDRKARQLGLTLQLAKEVDTLRRQGFLRTRK